MAVVIDVGGFETRCGYANDSVPTIVDRSIMSRCSSTGDYNFGKSAYLSNPLIETNCAMPIWSRKHLTTPLLTSSSDASFGRECLIKHVNNQIRRLTVSHCDGDHQYRHPVNIIIPEVWHEQHELTKATMEVFFDAQYGDAVYPGVYMSRPSVSIAIGMGKPSAIVIDVGHTQTTSAAVFDGYVIRRSIRSVALGGLTADLLLAQFLRARNFSIPISTDDKLSVMTMYAMECVNQFRTHSPGIEVTYPKMQPPFLNKEYNSINKECAEVTTVPFVAPDGQLVVLPSTDASSCYDCFFSNETNKSSLESQQNKAPQHYNIANMLLETKKASDPELASFLPLLLCGGLSQARGFTDRFAYEYNKIDLSGNDTLSNRPLPRGVSLLSWQGAAMATSSSAFSALWISHKEFQEEGTSVFTRKLFH